MFIRWQYAIIEGTITEKVEVKSLKYEFTGEQKTRYNRVLNRIRYLQDYPEQKVLQGQEGGWIESEKNLDQEDDSFVLNEAVVMNDATLAGNVIVKDNATIRGSAVLKGLIDVGGNSLIMGNSKLDTECSKHINEELGRLMVCGNTRIVDDALINGCGKITDSHVLNHSIVKQTGKKIFALESSFIKGKSVIDSSDIVRTFVQNGKITESFSMDSEVLDGSVQIEHSHLEHSKLSGMVQVKSSIMHHSLIQDESDIFKTSLINVMTKKKSKIHLSKLHSKKEFGILIDDEANLTGVNIYGTETVYVGGKVVLKYIDFRYIKKIHFEGNSSIIGSTKTAGFLASISFSNMSLIFMRDHSQILNESKLRLSFSDAQLQLFDYSKIEGVFQFENDVTLKDFAFLQNACEDVKAVIENPLVLQEDESILYPV